MDCAVALIVPYLLGSLRRIKTVMGNLPYETSPCDGIASKAEVAGGNLSRRPRGKNTEQKKKEAKHHHREDVTLKQDNLQGFCTWVTARLRAWTDGDERRRARQ